MRAAPRAASAWPSEATPAASLGERLDPPSHHHWRIVISRLVRAADFERVLRTRTRASSMHFAVHHVPAWPSLPLKPVREAIHTELSTGDPDFAHKPVDDFREPGTNAGMAGAPGTAMAALPSGLWLGAVVPKRHARRSVTRTLLKRQIRAAVDKRASDLPGGLWVIRLRAPFDRAHFVSAASDALRRAAHAELDGLMTSAVERAAAGR
jgi:ribonuclease P protein component